MLVIKTNMFYDLLELKMQSDNNELRLLPNKTKKYGWILLGVTIVFAVLGMTDVLPFGDAAEKNVAENLLLFSLLLLAVSKDKIEDEMTIKLRMQAFASSFIFGVVFVIIMPYINYLFDGEFFVNKGAFELLLTMLIFFFITHYFGKKNR